MILYQYPKSTELKDGGQLTIRLLRKEDEKALHKYFLRLPTEDGCALETTLPIPK